jgi:Brix domain
MFRRAICRVSCNACVLPQLVMADLEADLRKVMAPHTAPRLRESKRNVLRDFVHIAGPLGVTHFLILTATQRACYLRVAKSPRVSNIFPSTHR